MKAKKVAEKIKEVNLKDQYKELSKLYMEQAEDQVRRRTHGSVTRSTVDGVIKGLRNWSKAAGRKLGWPETLIDLFLSYQEPKVYKEYGFAPSGVEKYKKVVEEMLKSLSFKV